MATITIKGEGVVDLALFGLGFKGIGKVESIDFHSEFDTIELNIPRMSYTRFENVVKRVLTKNLTEQGITPLSIEYSE
jgi:hypothetical protein